MTNTHSHEKDRFTACRETETGKDWSPRKTLGRQDCQTRSQSNPWSRFRLNFIPFVSQSFFSLPFHHHISSQTKASPVSGNEMSRLKERERCSLYFRVVYVVGSWNLMKKERKTGTSFLAAQKGGPLTSLSLSWHIPQNSSDGFISSRSSEAITDKVWECVLPDKTFTPREEIGVNLDWQTDRHRFQVK